MLINFYDGKLETDVKLFAADGHIVLMFHNGEGAMCQLALTPAEWSHFIENAPVGEDFAGKAYVEIYQDKEEDSEELGIFWLDQDETGQRALSAQVGQIVGNIWFDSPSALNAFVEQGQALLSED